MNPGIQSHRKCPGTLTQVPRCSQGETWPIGKKGKKSFKILQTRFKKREKEKSVTERGSRLRRI